MNVSVQAYKALNPKRDNPEERLQIEVVKALDQLDVVGLLDVFWWGASQTGNPLTVGARAKAKRLGRRPGVPDLSFVRRSDGMTLYLELKAGAGLDPEQRRFKASAEPLGIWALAKSVGDVLHALTCWGCISKGEGCE